MLHQGQRTRSTRRSNARPGRQREAATGGRGLDTNRSTHNSSGQQYAAPRRSSVINVAKEMEHLHKLAVENQALRFPRLWEKIITEEWITQAWTEIRQNQGSQTPGIDGRTAKDIDLDRIRQLSRQLHENTYRPKSVRRVYIPKSNGKLRPLGIPMCHAYCISLLRRLGIAVAAPTLLHALCLLTQYSGLGVADQGGVCNARQKNGPMPSTW